MINIKNVSAGIAMMAVLGLLTVANVAHAEYPNILVNENMTIGSTGQGVVVLQGLLSEMGYLEIPAGVPFGYYGSMTKDALAKYQARTFITPSVGYFGPTTKVAMFTDFSNKGWMTILGWNK